MALTQPDSKSVARARRGRSLPGPRPRSERWYVLERRLAPYAAVSPFFLLFFAFGLFPIAYTAWVSLHRVDLQTIDKSEWVGLANYDRLLHSDAFWRALENTITIGLLSTVPQLLMALGIAYLLNLNMRGRTFLRVMILVPYLTSVAAATLVFAELFGRDYGLFNSLLGHVGVGPVSWEAGKWSSQIAISAIVTWRWTGYNALIYLAAMQAVPRELYDAAAVDGASRFRMFRHVTIPGIKPTILFTVIISTIGATQLFGEPLIFGGQYGHAGGSGHQYQTLGVLLYDQGWTNFHLGQAAATACTMFVIILAAVLVNSLLVRGRSHGGAS
jgi:cellobiose transport system permease protein